MAMENSGLSASDVLALSNKDDGLFGGGTSGGILALIIIFVLLFGNGNGFGFGGGGGYATQADVQRGFDNTNVISKLDGISNGICSLGYDQLNQMNGVNMNVMQSANAITQVITNLGYEQQSCCCNVNRNIDSVKYENARNTCDIVNAIHADGEATRAMMQNQVMQDLRDKLQDRDNTISNFIQTQNILGSIGRYVTNPPCPQGYGYGYGFNGTTIA